LRCVTNDWCRLDARRPARHRG